MQRSRHGDDGCHGCHSYVGRASDPLHRPPGTFDLALSALYYLGGIGCIKSATLDQENSRGPARPLLEVSGGRDAALDGD